MASLVTFSINLDKIDKTKIIKGKNNWLPLTLAINDEVDQYGNQGPVYHSQSKEEREAKQDRIFLGNAKVIWTNGENVDKAPWNEGGAPIPPAAPSLPEDDDLPF